jgi:hypothetical protein
MPRVRFTEHLTRFFPQLAAGEFAGSTIAEVLRDIDAQHPGLAAYLVDERGRLRQHVNIFIGSSLIRDRERLSDPVEPADDVFVFQALSGG